MVTTRNIPKHDHMDPPVTYQDAIDKIYNTSKEDGTRSISITFQVTENCNLACSYCYQICKSKKRMSFDVAKKAVDLILSDKNYIKNPVAVVLDFIGGEPLLEIELIDQIYDYFLSRCYALNHPWLLRHKVNIGSNGVLFLDERVQNFIKKYPDTVSFAITIDGPKHLHDSCRVFPTGEGSFDIVEKSIKYAVRNNLINTTKVTLAHENIQYLGEIIKYFYEDIGFENVHANCTFEGPWTLDDAKLFYKKLTEIADYCYENDTYSNFYISLFSEIDFVGIDYTKDNDNWCGGTGDMLAIDPDGKCYPCIRYMKSSLGDSVEPLIIGDVDNGLINRPCEKCICDTIRSITATSQSTDECINCPISHGCAWCSAYNYQITGTLNKRYTEICIMHKARALANVYYWNKFYEKHNVMQVYDNYLPDSEAVRIIGGDEWDKLCNIINKRKTIVNSYFGRD